MERRTFLHLAAASLALPIASEVNWANRPKRLSFQCEEIGLKLTATSFTDSLGTVSFDQLPDPAPECKVMLKNVTPLTERLWRNALAAIERNIVQTSDGKYFGAGTDYGLWIYTRDISYSGLLGLIDLFPQQLLDSLKVSRNIRRRLGFTVSGEGYFVPEIDVPWKSAGLDEQSFIRKNQTNSYTRATDDVVWLWCADQLLTKHGGKDDWKWMYETGTSYFDEFYTPFFDPIDGLYRGQASFIDIHFPERKSTAYPEDFTVQDCVLLKSVSTNCLYAQGLDGMAKASARLGLRSESKRWKEKAKALRAAVRQELRNGDGTFTFFKDRYGKLQPRREALGTALAVITRVVTGSDARQALAGFPITDGGIPLLLPFFQTPRFYHNNSAWPFVDTFFLRAWEQAYHVDRTALNAALLARICRLDGLFREVVDFRSKRPQGSRNQLWSAASFIDVCKRADLLANVPRK